MREFLQLSRLDILKHPCKVRINKDNKKAADLPPFIFSLYVIYLFYFPRQNFENIAFIMLSSAVLPVISPRAE